MYIKDPALTTPENIVAVCPSAHGKLNCATTGFTLTGSSPRIVYENTLVVNHALALSTEEGGKHPLIAWESLPAPAVTALQDTDFGSANVPIKNGNFENNIALATF